jgi:mRNA-degrading endonuclease RelE of RelBE toxin-antitoxin system
MIAYQADIPPHVAQIIRHFPPDLKRSIESALKILGENPYKGTPLLAPLEGFWKYRVKRCRLVYSIDRARRTIRVLAVGHRSRIYDEVAALAREFK